MLEDVCFRDLLIAVLVEHIEYKSEYFLPRKGVEVDQTHDELLEGDFVVDMFIDQVEKAIDEGCNN